MLRKNKFVVDEIGAILDERINNASNTHFRTETESLDTKTLLRSCKRFGTPQYVLDRKMLVERARYFKDTFAKYIPNAEFFYAFKCNDLPALINAVKATGFQADAAGMFELELALRLAFDKILFSSPGKSEEELALALSYPDRVIVNIDNLDELGLLLGLSKKAKGSMRVCFRVNVDPKGVWSKFGVSEKELMDGIASCQRSNLRFTGLHFHCSWNKTPDRYLANIKKIGSLLTALTEKQLGQIEFIDIGGGFFPENTARINRIEDKGIILSVIQERAAREDVWKKMSFSPHKFSIRRVERLESFARKIARSIDTHILGIRKDVKIFLEPGRFIATHPTMILLRVESVKENGIVVDGGINLVGDYRFEEYDYAPIVNLSAPSLQVQKQTVFGPLCDPSDLWGFEYYGRKARKGDVLAVLQQGAYTFSTAWRFIKPIAPYIVMDGKKLTVGKKRESFEMRYAGCQL